jgi:hypothetical protein
LPDVGFRYDRADLLKAVAERRGVGLSTLLRSLADSAVASEGFPVAEQQYCLVRDGELITTGFKPAKDDDGGVWLPIENQDNQPFDPALHWRLKPLPLRLDGERVLRVYPVVAKSQEHS